MNLNGAGNLIFENPEFAMHRPLMTGSLRRKGDGAAVGGRSGAPLNTHSETRDGKDGGHADALKLQAYVTERCHVHNGRLQKSLTATAGVAMRAGAGIFAVLADHCLARQILNFVVNDVRHLTDKASRRFRKTCALPAHWLVVLTRQKNERPLMEGAAA